jgi:hypothetical protein
MTLSIRRQAFRRYGARRWIQMHAWLIGCPFVACKAPTNPKSAYNFSKPWATLAWQNQAINTLKYKAKALCAQSSRRLIRQRRQRKHDIASAVHLPHTKLAIISANAIHIGRAYPSIAVREIWASDANNGKIWISISPTVAICREEGGRKKTLSSARWQETMV